MKKNFLFGLIGAGALILSGSVGFAAWTIKNSTDSKEETVLKITADATVQDESLQLTENECKWTDSTVQFKPVKKTGSPSGWLSVSDPADTTDDLTASYQIKGKASAKATITIQATFEDTTQKSTTDDVKSYQDLTTLGTNSEKTPGTGIVGELPKPIIGSSGAANTGSVTADADGSFTASISVTFSWGAAFGGKNPYEYYNSKAYTKDLATEAKTNIGYLVYLPKCSFKLTVNVTAA